MATVIRPEVSKRNKYWIGKHRHYELKHFCLQYPEWKKEYDDYGGPSTSLYSLDNVRTNRSSLDPTAKNAIDRLCVSEKMHLIERTALETDEELRDYILKAVTEGLSYTTLKSKYDIPCGKDVYYDRYRRFFWLLNKAKP